MPHSDAAIHITGLTKTYAARGQQPAKTALTGIDLTVHRGEMFGLLGPNGAGKSTCINILAGLVRKTAGRVVVWGTDIDRDARTARASIGVVPQELNIDPFFTPRQALELQAGLYGVAKGERHTDQILAALGLTDKADAYARSLSGGMRRRLMVAKALVHAPPVLVLDEPTAGVDVELRQQLWAYVRDLNRSGTTVVLTTHYLEEAEALCDRIAIIANGRLVACDATASLIARLDGKALHLTLPQPLAEAPPSLAAYQPSIRGTRLTLRFRPSEVSVATVLAAVERAGIDFTDLATEEANLEDAFLQLTRAAA
ncbi:MAG: ABC transporter ATP-binding protein [Alphaproteobacteria bacterium]|nr:MAG: ABC transporter ATP-binding protein [Alphaproteobacteria bacterium]